MRVPDDSSGRKTRCPKCSRALRVPVRRAPEQKPAADDEGRLRVLQKVAPVAQPPTVESSEEDDVIVVEDQPGDSDDVIVVEDEAPVSEDIEIVEAEPSEGSDSEAGDRNGDQDASDPELTGGEKINRAGRPSKTRLRAGARSGAIVGSVLSLAGVGSLAASAFAPSGLYLAIFAGFGLALLACGGMLLFARWRARHKAS
jgi:hypothetical protein